MREFRTGILVWTLTFGFLSYSNLKISEYEKISNELDDEHKVMKLLLKLEITFYKFVTTAIFPVFSTLLNDYVQDEDGLRVLGLIIGYITCMLLVLKNYEDWELTDLIIADCLIILRILHKQSEKELYWASLICSLRILVVLGYGGVSSWLENNTMHDENNKTQLQIRIERWAKGIYFLHLRQCSKSPRPTLYNFVNSCKRSQMVREMSLL